MANMARYALVAAFCSSMATAQAAVNITSPSAATFTGTTQQFIFDQNGGNCANGSLFVDTDNGPIFSTSWGATSPSPVTVTGLPDDGSMVYVEVGCRQFFFTEFGYRDYVSFTDTGGGTTGGVTGTVTLDPNATVQLAPDSALQIDSGLTEEQFSALAGSILLTVVTAIGIRQVLKVLT